MKIVVFSDIILGHYLEYIHHIYIGALNRSHIEFIFVIPKHFLDVKDIYSWPESNNISFYFISKEDNEKCLHSKPLKAALNKSLYIKKICREINPDRIILLNLSAAIPFLPFLLPSGTKASGIQYRIYRYNSISGVRLFLEKVRYMVMALHNKVEKVFILNDNDSSQYFNITYKTKKFHFLPDPVPNFDHSQLRNLRDLYNIPKENKIFLLFGALAERKGVMLTLDAVDSMTPEQQSNVTLIFAGIIGNSIRDKYYKRINENIGYQVITIDKFCSYDLLFNLCYTSDVILAPYYNPSQSSGVIGYAASFNKPLIGTSAGLLGKIINKYQLGIALTCLDKDELKNAMLSNIICNGKQYTFDNSIDNFWQTLI